MTRERVFDSRVTLSIHGRIIFSFLTKQIRVPSTSPVHVRRWNKNIIKHSILEYGFFYTQVWHDDDLLTKWRRPW